MIARAATSRQFRSAVLLLALIVCALVLKPVQDRIDIQKAHGSAEPDLLYFGSPKALKMLALGYDSFVADIYWMRAIQYYGRRDEADRRPVRYKNLAALLDITTTLDSRMLEAYRAGSSFLAEPDPLGAGKPEEALKLLDKGITLNPSAWRLYFDKGFIYYLFLKDFQKAAHVWLEGSKVQGAPHWMEALVAMAMSRGGAIDTAKALWQRQYNESNRADVRANARNHLHSIQVDEDLWTLEFFIKKYTETAGDFPAHLRDLVRAGYIRQIPLDPSGVPYSYDSFSGKVRLNAATKVRYVALPYNYRATFIERLRGRTTGSRMDSIR
jgi:hypothetical protein